MQIQISNRHSSQSAFCNLVHPGGIKRIYHYMYCLALNVTSLPKPLRTKSPHICAVVMPPFYPEAPRRSDERDGSWWKKAKKDYGPDHIKAMCNPKSQEFKAYFGVTQVVLTDADARLRMEEAHGFLSACQKGEAPSMRPLPCMKEKSMPMATRTHGDGSAHGDPDLWLPVTTNWIGYMSLSAVDDRKQTGQVWITEAPPETGQVYSHFALNYRVPDNEQWRLKDLPDIAEIHRRANGHPWVFGNSAGLVYTFKQKGKMLKEGAKADHQSEYNVVIMSKFGRCWELGYSKHHDFNGKSKVQRGIRHYWIKPHFAQTKRVAEAMCNFLCHILFARPVFPDKMGGTYPDTIPSPGPSLPAVEHPMPQRAAPNGFRSDTTPDEAGAPADHESPCNDILANPDEAADTPADHGPPCNVVAAPQEESEWCVISRTEPHELHEVGSGLLALGSGEPRTDAPNASHAHGGDVPVAGGSGEPHATTLSRDEEDDQNTHAIGGEPKYDQPVAQAPGGGVSHALGGGEPPAHGGGEPHAIGGGPAGGEPHAVGGGPGGGELHALSLGGSWPQPLTRVTAEEYRIYDSASDCADSDGNEATARYSPRQPWSVMSCVAYPPVNPTQAEPGQHTEYGRLSSATPQQCAASSELDSDSVAWPDASNGEVLDCAFGQGAGLESQGGLGDNDSVASSGSGTAQNPSTMPDTDWSWPQGEETDTELDFGPDSDVESCKGHKVIVYNVNPELQPMDGLPVTMVHQPMSGEPREVDLSLGAGWPFEGIANGSADEETKLHQLHGMIMAQGASPPS